MSIKIGEIHLGGDGDKGNKSDKGDNKQSERTIIKYALKKSLCSKSVRLSICCGGNVTVSAPYFASHSTIENFMRRKADWIVSKIEYFKKVSDSCRRYSFVDGRLVVNTARISTSAERKRYLSLKDEALIRAENKVTELNTIYNFKFNKISIKNQKTRWGSCSRNGNLNFNYKIAILPEKLADYLVVHELCHLGEFNHSSRFWKLVERAVPDYKARRVELKKFGKGNVV